MTRATHKKALLRVLTENLTSDDTLITIPSVYRRVKRTVASQDSRLAIAQMAALFSFVSAASIC
jgi:hypothetical protein